PDGEKMAVVVREIGWDPAKGEITIWRVHDGALLRKKSIPLLSYADLAFSPDSWRLAVQYMTIPNWKTGPQPFIHETRIMHWDLETDKQTIVHECNQESHFKIIFAPDGKSLAFCAPDLFIWSIAEQKMILSGFKMGRLLAISPGGTF